MPTPMEKAGYKIGDVFTVTRDSNFNKGDVIVFSRDDGSSIPYFTEKGSEVDRCEDMKLITKIETKSNAVTEYSVNVTEKSSYITVNKPLSADVVAKIVTLIAN